MKNKPQTPVRDFRCERCGVIIKGVRSADGRVYATNRPYTDTQVEPAVCATCASSKPAAKG